MIGNFMRNLVVIAILSAGSFALRAQTLSGTYPVGASSPTYQKLTQVAAALNSSTLVGNVVFELQSDYDGTTGETFPITFNQILRSGAYSVIIRPATNAVNLVTSGDPGSTVPVITINGADSLSFDGRAGGTGTTINWTVRNTRTAATVGSSFVFQNDATRDTLRYLRVEGQNTAVGNATVLFSTSNGTLGNSNNVVENNDIRDRSDVTGVPHSAINSSGTAAAPNNANTIRGNTIRNFTVNGIRVTSNSNSWVIGGPLAANGNNIYQEAARSTAFTSIGISAGNTFTISNNKIYQVAGTNTAAMTGISVVGSGNGHTVNNNSIGGANANRTGAAMISTAGATSIAIVMTVGTTTASNVYSNSISNWGVSVTGTLGAAFGIQVTAGNVNVGTLGGNTIGGAAITGVPSDTLITSYDNGWIAVTGGTTVVIENNTVTNASYYRGANDRNCGIYVNASTTPVVRNNTVRALKGNNTSTNASTFITMGIYTSVTGTTIEGNTVTDILNINSTAAAPAVKGIFWAAASGTVRNNRISNIRSNGTQTGTNAPWIHGIYVSTGAPAIHNNYIAVGMNSGNECRVNGITFNSTTNPGGAVNYNTVYVTGTSAAGTNNTFAILRISTSNTTFRNNFLYNERTGGTGGHYAIGNTAGTPATNWNASTSNNNYFVTVNAAQTGMWGTTASTLSQWQVSSTGDLNTGYSVSTALPSATVFVAPATGNLKINPSYYTIASDLESKGQVISGLTVDIENDTRPGPVGSVNGGGTAPDIGADEFDGTPVSLDIGVSILVTPLTTGCHTNCEFVRVRIHNYSSVPVNLALNPATVTASVTGQNPIVFAPLTISSGTIAGLGNLDTSVTICYNMSASGTYVFNASATLTGDGNPGNNAMPATSITLSGGSVVAPNGGRLCAGNSVTLTVTGYTTGGTIQWQQSPDGIVWTNIINATSPSYAATPNDTLLYRALICGQHASIADTLFPTIIVPPTTTNGTICGAGAVTLHASGSGTLHWYHSPTGGISLATGGTYSPNITATDTFYVESVAGAGSAVVGPASNSIGTGAQSTAPQWLNFDVFANTTLVSVVIYPGAAGTVTLEQRDNTGTNVINTTSMTVTAAQVNTPVVMALNWNLTPGTGYRMYRAGSVSLYRNDAGASYPYTAPGILSITGNSFSTTYYYWGYNWQIASGCSSTRTMVIGMVVPAPPITATSSNNVCGSGTATLTASSPNAGYAYVWSPAATLNTPNGNTVVASPTTTTTYTVTGTDNQSGCVNTASVTVTHAIAPSVVAVTASDSVCPHTSVQLNANPTFTNPAIIGTGNVQNTTTTYPAPYGNYYYGSRHQMLMLASELTAAGLTAGYINALSFEVATINGSGSLTDFEIKLAQTNVTSITTFQAAAFQSVFFSPSYPPSMGINTHNFSTPFYWDGVSNILVETCHNNVAPYTQNCTFRQTATSFNSTVYFRQDAAGVCANNSVSGFSAQRPNMRLWRSTAGWQYSWTPTATLNNPAIKNPTATPLVSTTYVVNVTDSISGCVSTSSVFVYVHPDPTPSLGADTAICSNTVLTLNAGSGPYTYLWQNNSTAQTFPVNSFGTYSVTVTDVTTGCTGSDAILVGINAAPAFTLGADVTVCQGAQVTFAGPAGPYSYLWSTSASTVNITTGTAGSYALAVTDAGNGCTSRDTVVLNVNPLPMVALGNDTSVCTASGPLTLSAPVGNYSYAWSTSASSMSINVNATGNYHVLVTDNATSCFKRDTIFVTYNASPVANLGSDTTFCSANGPITLTAPAGPYQYQWNNMSTGMTVQAGSTGLYYVHVLDTITGCNASDSIMINVPASPSFVLTDTSFCGTQFTINGPAGAYNYSWSTSANTQSITVTTSGTYTLTVTDIASGCTGSDVSTVNINTAPTVTVSGSSLTPCADDANVILTGTPAGGTFTGTSVTGNQFDPSFGAGTYPIVYTYTDVNGCTGTATVTITVSQCVGINEQSAASGMGIYPNPNAGKFVFTAADQHCASMTIELVTVEGQVILSDKHSNVQGNFTQEIDLNDFANGVYILRVTTDGAVYTNRVVKQD